MFNSLNIVTDQLSGQTGECTQLLSTTPSGANAALQPTFFHRNNDITVRLCPKADSRAFSVPHPGPSTTEQQPSCTYTLCQTLRDEEIAAWGGGVGWVVVVGGSLASKAIAQ